MIISTLRERPRPARILMVEDNRGDIILIKRALHESGFVSDVIEARSGEQALELLTTGEQSIPDLVMLDLNLPGISGQEVLGVIKNHDRLKRIPVFVLSSSQAAEDVLQSYASHANCYLVKPHDMAALKEIIEGIHMFWGTLVLLPDSAHEGRAA